jgi:hypothetical protein
MSFIVRTGSDAHPITCMFLDSWKNGRNLNLGAFLPCVISTKISIHVTLMDLHHKRRFTSMFQIYMHSVQITTSSLPVTGIALLFFFNFLLRLN